jgi:hypothetical protein
MLQIPAIEWDKKTINGTSTIGSSTITGVANTSSISVGMIVQDSAFPYPSLVVSKTATTITLDHTATSNKTGAFDFYRRFDFTYPAKKDQGEQLKVNQSKAFSLSGVQQTITNYIEAERNLTFSFLTLSEKTTIQNDFFVAWAAYGKSFRYFNDKENNVPTSYQMDTSDWKQTRIIKKHPDYLYEIDLKFRRVV